MTKCYSSFESETADLTLIRMDTEHIENVNNNRNTQITYYFETFYCQDYNFELNLVQYFQHNYKLDICGKLYYSTGVQYVQFHC